MHNIEQKSGYHTAVETKLKKDLDEYPNFVNLYIGK